MLSVYKRDREKGTLESPRTQFIKNLLNRYDVSKTSSTPTTPCTDVRHTSEEETVVDVLFREIVGIFMSIAYQTRPDTARMQLGQSLGFRMNPSFLIITRRHRRFWNT